VKKQHDLEENIFGFVDISHRRDVEQTPFIEVSAIMPSFAFICATSLVTPINTAFLSCRASHGQQAADRVHLSSAGYKELAAATMELPTGNNGDDGSASLLYHW
jgi:hypothetical protein